VFAEGRGERGLQVAQDAAQVFQAERISLDDPDAMSFCCATESFPEFANSLYARLDSAFAVAGKKAQG
jgi:hypothetical protein